MQNSIILSPSGSQIFAWVEAKSNRSFSVLGGPIFLLHGNKKFGREHIFLRHASLLEKKGFFGLKAVGDYVASILANNTPVYSENLPEWEDSRLLALRSSLGVAVMAQKKIGNFDVAYSVVTAYQRPQLGYVQVSRVVAHQT